MKKDTGFAEIHLIEDQPLDDLERDYLGLSPWAKMIAGTAVGTPGPFTIGVHGEWGYGKTTLLKLAKALVEKYHEGVVTVWFNAWQFEREEHPLLSLIAAIADEVERKAGSKGREKLRKVGLSLRALTRGMKFKGEVGIPLVGQVGVEFDAKKALEAEELIGRQTNPLAAEMMYHSAFGMLEEAARAGRGTDAVKIVVFVDDLDRCHPDKAVSLLESIKLILAQPGFIFVIAVDRSVIESYLEKRYAEQCGEGLGDRGRFYMDKIIQLPIVIPSHRSRFAGFVEGIVKELDEHHGAESEPMKALRSVQGVISTGAATNPRSLIRLVNNVLLDCKLWPLIEHEQPYRELTGGVAAALAFNRILQQELRELYTHFIAAQEVCDAIRDDGIKGLQQFVAKREPREEAAERTEGLLRPREREDPLVLVARALLVRPEFVQALHEHGGRWLNDEKLRHVVHEFAQTERAEPVATDFPEPVALAIRRELGLQPDEPIPAGRLAEIEELNLSHMQVTDAELAHVKSLCGLQALDLSETHVTDAGLAHLKTLSGLQKLNLWGTQVTDVGLGHVKSLCGLQALGLVETHVTDAGLAHLKTLSGLQELNLWGTQVTDVGLEHLMDLCELESLGLSRTSVTDAGLVHLKSLFRLWGLCLSHTGVTDEGLEHLKGLRELQVLYLSGTVVTDVGLARLESLSGLQILYLSGTWVKDAGLAHLKTFSDLRQLDLSRTQVTDAGLAHLSSLPRLHWLSLWDTQVTEDGVRALKKALPHLEVYGL